LTEARWFRGGSSLVTKSVGRKKRFDKSETQGSVSLNPVVFEVLVGRANIVHEREEHAI
jgi:hypothetical protein